ncbi:MAG TPA: hypothetical protein VK766_05655 [Cytophagaceae bacterium]|jgi:hypothetical protein|nr:hypothetical protein [Cytophagaceae bacterium]
MIFPKAKKIAKALDWYKTKDTVFGLYKGYFFNMGDSSLLSNPQSKYVIVTTDTLTEEQKLEINTALESNKKKLKFSNFEVDDQTVFVQFIEIYTYTKLKTVYALFDFLVDLLTKIGIPKDNKCHNCETNGNLKYYDLNDTGTLLCNSCYKQFENSFYEVETEAAIEEKNYLTGFLGSIVFSIPGIIAWVLIAVYLERLASAMAMVIAFLGIKGYEYFKGQQGKLTKYIIVLSNIVCILIANAATIIALLLNEGFTISESFTELQTNEVARSSLYKDMITSFVLSFLIWIWLLFLLKDQKLSIKLADKFEK